MAEQPAQDMLDSQVIRRMAFSAGADIAGLADPRVPCDHASQVRSWVEEGLAGPMEWYARSLPRRLNPLGLLPEARSVLCIGVSYNGSCVLPARGPRISRYALGRDYHRVLHRILRGVVHRLRAVRPELKHKICVDTVPLLERYWAWQAGLGWIGRNCMLINRRFGSWIFLGSLLLDLDLTPDAPVADRCGTCRRCLDACPTSAFREAYRLDANRCISALTIELRPRHARSRPEDSDRPAALQRGVSEPDAPPLPAEFHPMPGGWLFGCDDCQTACPWNGKAEGAGHPDFRPDPWILNRMQYGDWPDPGDEDSLRAFWDRLTRGKALRRMNPDMFRRNLVACLSDSGHRASDTIPERGT